MVRQNVDSIVSRGLEFVSELRSELENKLGGVAPIPKKVWSPSEMEFVPMIKGPITRRLHLFYKGSYRDDDDSMITGYSSDLALRAGID